MDDGMIEVLSSQIIRELDRLRSELKMYPDEQTIWVLDKQVNNSAGTLALHMCGNLRHFICEVLANSGYKRDRDGEFNSKVSLEELIGEIDNTKIAIGKAFDRIESKTLNDTYPIEVLGKPMTVQYFLVHLLGHLNYHLGQVSYHRRLTT